MLGMGACSSLRSLLRCREDAGRGVWQGGVCANSDVLLRVASLPGPEDNHDGS